MPNTSAPKFGNWENEGDFLYTQYFESARKGKSGGRPVNPNDPNEYPEASSKDPPSAHASPLRLGSDQRVPKPKDERRAGREDDFRRHDATAQKPHAESPNHRHGDAMRKTGRASGGYDNSVERSPLHPHHPHARQAGQSSSDGSRGNAPTTPGRSKNRLSGRGDETPDRGSTVPKFGEWDEKDPSTGEGFTGIFDKVREEKQSGSAKVPIITTNDADHPGRSHPHRKYESSSCSCFGWCMK